MALSIVLVYRFWVRLSTCSSLPERLYSTKRFFPTASAGRAYPLCTLFSRVPPRLYTTQLSSPSSTKLPDSGSMTVSSLMPVCWGQPALGVMAICTLSTRSLTRAMEVPTMPVAIRIKMVSAATMSAPCRSRRLRTRCRAASRYSTRPSESGSPLTGRPPR